MAIDDEPLALAQIKKYITRTEGLELVGAYLSATQARAAMKETEVDLLLLDINMPDVNGMAFAQSLPAPRPWIIFTTAYPEYAAEGFRLDAVDYLLKPLAYSTFKEAISRVKKRRLVARIEQEQQHPEPADLYVKSGGRNVKIALNDIRYIKGQAEYVQIFISTASQPVTTLLSMKKLIEMLPANRFMRIHRSYIVNLERLTAYDNYSVTIDDDTFPIGDTYRHDFPLKIKQFRSH